MINVTIGERIKKKREELKLSQEELAEKMGYKSKTSIHKSEQGITDLPQSKILYFAKELQTSVGYLMGWEDETNTFINPIVDKEIEQYQLDEYELSEYKKIKNMNMLMFNDKELSQERKEKLEAALKEVFVEELLKRRASNKK